LALPGTDWLAVAVGDGVVVAPEDCPDSVASVVSFDVFAEGDGEALEAAASEEGEDAPASGDPVPSEPVVVPASPGSVEPSAAEDPAGPCLPSASPGAGPPPENANPAISAAADTAPTAPAATATRRERQGLGLRREPVRERRDEIRGSSAVSSYAFCQPCATAGSAYSSYGGGGSVRGWYTFGGTWGSLARCVPFPYSSGLDMAADCRDGRGPWDSYRR
jgi:hypothetical protein